nr:hypothetical protein [uncultured Flavobacterium sp.]
MNSKPSFLKITIFFVIICCGFVNCKKKSEKINISKDEALEIAKRYDISGDSIQIDFKTYIYSKSSLAYKKGKRKLLYWDVSKQCNTCGIIQIDAESGNVFTIGKYKYQN